MQRLAAQLEGLCLSLPNQLTVNGAGAFEVGGPKGDNGLSGKKLVMDAYGPCVPIGGGAWSGKDFFKADRAGGLHARRLAKLVVQLGLAAEATVKLLWFSRRLGGSIARNRDADGPRKRGKFRKPRGSYVGCEWRALRCDQPRRICSMGTLCGRECSLGGTATRLMPISQIGSAVRNAVVVASLSRRLALRMPSPGQAWAGIQVVS
jgi:S-adenosylmethionine synthetase, C-terminal domain